MYFAFILNEFGPKRKQVNLQSLQICHIYHEDKLETAFEKYAIGNINSL